MQNLLGAYYQCVGSTLLAASHVPHHGWHYSQGVKHSSIKCDASPLEGRNTFRVRVRVRVRPGRELIVA